MGATRTREVNGRPDRFVYWVTASWALFHIWYVSPLPYTFEFGIFNSTEARSISLAIAVFLGLSCYPIVQSARHNPIKSWELVWALLGASAAAYLFLFYEDISDRAGVFPPMVLGVGVVGLVMLIDAVRRVIALPAAIGAIGCIGFLHFGSGLGGQTWNNSLNDLIGHLWLSTEGVFGITLGVSVSMGFLGILLGSGLDRLRFGSWIIEMLFQPYFSDGRDGDVLIPRWLEGRFWAWVFALQFLSGINYIGAPEILPVLIQTGLISTLLFLLIGSNFVTKYVRNLIGSKTGSWTWSIFDTALIVILFVGAAYFFPEQVVYVLIALAVIAYRRMNEGPTNENGENIKGDITTEIKTSAYGIVLVALLSSLLTITMFSFGLLVKMLDINISQTASLSFYLFVGGVVLIAVIALLVFTEKTPSNNRMPLVLFIVCIAVLASGQYVFGFSPGLSAFKAVISCAAVSVLTPVANWFIHRRGTLPTVALTAFEGILDWMALGGRNAIPLLIYAAATGIVIGTITYTGAGLWFS